MTGHMSFFKKCRTNTPFGKDITMVSSIFSLRDLGQENIWRVLRTLEQNSLPPLPANLHVLLLADHTKTSTLSRKHEAALDALTATSAIAAKHITQLPDSHENAESTANTFLFLSESTSYAAFLQAEEQTHLPCLNMGCKISDPVSALADLALLRTLIASQAHIPSTQEPLEGLRIAWTGRADTGLAASLIEASMYIPFELFMAIPETHEPDHSILDLALRAGARIFLTRDQEMALNGAHCVYAGASHTTQSTPRTMPQPIILDNGNADSPLKEALIQEYCPDAFVMCPDAPQTGNLSPALLEKAAQNNLLRSTYYTQALHATSLFLASQKDAS